AGTRARGATLYVTLEPCDHHGLTAPCSQAILAAGLRRVVVADRDPDPRVRGLGLKRLVRAGMVVEVGLLGAEAARLNAAYHHYHATGRPLVALKLAMSLDGKIALRSGPARWITGEVARRAGHLLRAQADAILIGAGTLRSDDPQLTVRGVPGRSPVRVVLSQKLGLPLAARLFHDGAAPSWVLAPESAARGPAGRRLRARGVTLVPYGPGKRRPGARARSRAGSELRGALEALAGLGVRRLLVEGGVEVASALLAARLVDRIHLHVAPIILGGEHPGWPMGLGIQRIAQALRLESVQVRPLGADLAIEGRLPSAS
ncbi:MAG TPA: bifunctional diaminohydroxyphosphoribosylaminopyrimidine deaminase/5-amino-6-(5-phosphoribosylamino)uracil reductase RibD, partial [Candidatus Udaeobacter sp.]|nr:bifunctional diaminohydroxyphosphoribosylaminopyrimidine deaminase/5-amino-6-(5-phosphoribosylamino)uracil reductase RibD [Candidatus Udaeobacter sp.]